MGRFLSSLTSKYHGSAKSTTNPRKIGPARNKLSCTNTEKEVALTQRHPLNAANVLAHRTCDNLIATAALSRYTYFEYFDPLMIQAFLWYFLIETIRTGINLSENITCSQNNVFLWFLMNSIPILNRKAGFPSYPP
jgi:hypothetical protein